MLALALAVAVAKSSLPASAALPAHAAPGPESHASVSEAERHFRRGVELYADGDMPAAFVEFSRAYELVPNYKILYNLAQVAYRRQDYVRSLLHFRGYLAAGGDAIAPERRRQVQTDVARLEQRVGQIAIEVATDDRGAEVRIDDVQVATAPLPDPIAANVGPRKIELVRSTGEKQVRLVDVVGGETTHVRFPRSSVRLIPPTDPLARSPSASRTALLSDAAGARTTTASGNTWLGWSVAAALAAGAGVTGVLAFSSSRELQQRRDSYPLATGELDAVGQRAHRLALVSDGLLIGAALAAAWSLYSVVSSPLEERPLRGTPDGAAGRLSAAGPEPRRWR